MAGKKAKKAIKRRNGQWSFTDPKPVPVTLWDMGATGPANQMNKVIEDRGDICPVTGRTINVNGVKGARRYDMIEVWHKRGVISTAGYNAAEKLRDAFEATQRAPGWPDNTRVQSSPKPDHAITIQVDRISRYAKLSAHVTRADWPIIEACVIDGKTPAAVRGYRGRRYKIGVEHLRDALDRVAASMSGG